MTTTIIIIVDVAISNQRGIGTRSLHEQPRKRRLLKFPSCIVNNSGFPRSNTFVISHFLQTFRCRTSVGAERRAEPAGTKVQLELDRWQRRLAG